MLNRLIPWAVGALLLGIVTGFAVGQIGDDGGDPQDPDASTETTVAPADGSSTTAASQTPPPTGSITMSCIGAPLTPTTFVAVAGIAGPAKALADKLGVPEVPVLFDDLNNSRLKSDFEKRMLDAAEGGPVVYVVQKSPGVTQTTFATNLIAQSANSAVVVVDKAGPTPGQSALEDVPPARSVAVPTSVGAEPDFSQAWATEVETIINGGATCRPSGG